MNVDHSAIHKILVVGPSWVGDMVMAQSLFRALKADKPNVIIDVLAMDWTRPLLQRMPEVNEAISMPINHGSFGWKQRKNLATQIAQKQYDQAIVLPNSWKSALIPWFAGIPVRTGWRGEMRYGLLNDIRTLDKEALPMMVQRFVSLAYPASQATAAPSYMPPLMQSESPRAAINPTPEAGQPRLILCPGAEFGPAKQWPPEHYATLAEHFLTEGWQIIILGSKADQKTAEEITEHIATDKQDNLFNLTGKTTLEDAIDLLGTADSVVSNDSGLMHIAAAMQRPLVALYGPTSPSFTPPLADNARILQIEVDCGPCFQRICPEGHHRCMQDLQVNRVKDLIEVIPHEHSK
ncbi:lipopolysaccharide heptosyltransferase II [Methylophaga sp.]|uniref:lipopolysaccharide heptosyltransferase II n=1 Tax=Methylophaga sp. TaxID=2024840 RepID=UPI003F6A188E